MNQPEAKTPPAVYLRIECTAALEPQIRRKLGFVPTGGTIIVRVTDADTHFVAWVWDSGRVDQIVDLLMKQDAETAEKQKPKPKVKRYVVGVDGFKVVD